MADKSSVPYIPNTEAAQEYEEAMRLLRESLDARKKPLFDPTLLAISAGAAKPTKTGGWGEMLGNVSESLYSEQERARKQQEQDIASRMELARFGMAVEQQKQRGKAFETLRGGQPTGGLPAAAPTGGAEVGAVPAYKGIEAQPLAAPAGGFEAPPGMRGVEGVQVQPPNPAFAGREQYLRMAEFDPSISPAKAMETSQDLEKKRYETKENGIIDLKTGMFYPFPKGELVERRIMGAGEGQSYKVDQRTAALLDLYASTNDPRYFEVADRVLYGVKKPGEEKGARLPSLAEQAEKEAEAKTAAEARGKLGVESEAALKQRDTAARMLYANAQDVKNRLAQSKTYFGLFNRPGLMSALGKLVNEGFRAGATSVSLGGFEDTIRQMMPGVTQKDLDNVAAAAGSLAEIELAFTKLYLAGQGQVTEGERAVVRRIPGTISSSPAVLKDKMDLLSMRSQFDMDLADKYRSWKKANPGKSYNKFEESDDYTNAVNRFQEQLGQRFGTAAAVPSSRRQPAERPGGWASRLQ
jgi:hypothetical protein